MKTGGKYEQENRADYVDDIEPDEIVEIHKRLRKSRQFAAELVKYGTEPGYDERHHCYDNQQYEAQNKDGVSHRALDFFCQPVAAVKMLRHSLQRPGQITAGLAGKHHSPGELVKNLWKFGDSTREVLAPSYLVKNVTQYILKLKVLYIRGNGFYSGGDGNAALDHRGQLPAKRSHICGFYTSSMLFFRGLFDGLHYLLDGNRR